MDKNRNTLKKAIASLVNKEDLPEGLYATKWGYYSVKHTKKNSEKGDEKNSILKRESNFIFNVKRKVVSTSNKFDVESRHKLEIQTILDGKPTKPVIFEPDLLTNPQQKKGTKAI